MSKPHVCNYASHYKPTLCKRLAEDGHRYCWQHRKSNVSIDVKSAWAIAREYNNR